MYMNFAVIVMNKEIIQFCNLLPIVFTSKIFIGKISGFLKYLFIYFDKDILEDTHKLKIFLSILYIEIR